MIKNLTTNQMILIAIASMLLLMAAFSFYLLQDPSAPLPFSPPPETNTSTPLAAEPTNVTAPTATSAPTRQTSYTPFVVLTSSLGTPSEVPNLSQTPATVAPTSPGAPTNTATVKPTGTSPYTPSPTSATYTPSPTSTPTLSASEYGVTGRIMRNGTPTANVKVEFADDVSTHQATTNPGGHYWFITLDPGSIITLTFRQPDNPQLTPVPEIASLAWIEGTLPTGINIIDLPDFEISIDLNGMIFSLQTPADGATYSAAAISPSYQIPFNWSLYNQGETYFVQLGPNGGNDPIWTSNEVTYTSLMWNGTLDNGSHITQGAYWWRVAAKKSLGNYTQVVFTQQSDIVFNP